MRKILATVGLGAVLVIGGPSVNPITPIGLDFGPPPASADNLCRPGVSVSQCKRNCTGLARQGKRDKGACDAWCEAHCPR